MKYQAEKNIDYEDATLKFVVKFTLNDECHNGVCRFSITGDEVCVRGKEEVCKKGDLIFGGACHSRIAKHFPELVPFLPLHLCDEFGQPLYPVDNFIHHSNRRVAKEKVCAWYRVTEEELEILKKCTINKLYFQYHLFQLGIVDRWKQEAETAITWLEEKTGEKFETESSQHALVIGPWYDEMEKSIEAGNFTPESIQEKVEKKHQAWAEKQIEEINAQYEQASKFINRRKELALWCVKNVPTENYSFFGYNGPGYETNPQYKLTINYRSWKEVITKEEYNTFLENVDIPKDLEITFNEIC